MGIFDKIVTFNNQSYSTNFDVCRSNNALFVDTTFQITSQNFYGTDKFTNVEWKRPGDIVSDPRLFCSTNSSIINGEASNKLLAPCLSLVRRKDCLKKLIPDMETQGWVVNKQTYFGIFKFRFWKCGELIEVVIDDLLPTIDNKLICMTSDVPNEFWCALVEKAYAKMCGSYKEIYEFSEEEIMIDFTGGVPEVIYFDEQLENKACEDYFRALETEYNEQTLILVKIKFDLPEEQLKGLTGGDTFSVTNVKTANVKNTRLSVMYRKDKLNLIRLCSANGHKQWTGPFSELNDEILDTKSKIKIGISVAMEGDFWVTYLDIRPLISCIIYIRLPILNVVSGALSQAIPGIPNRRVPSWKITTDSEFWYGPVNSIEEAISGKGGGGQYAFDIQASGPTNTPHDVMIHLVLMCAKQAEVPFSLVLFQIETNRQTVLFSTKWATKLYENHIDHTRSLGVYYHLSPGTYMIKAYIRDSIPDSMNYHLRLFTPNKNNGRFLWSEPPNPDSIVCLCMPEDCVLITRLRIVSISGLPWEKKYTEVFAEIECEGLVLNSNLAKKKEDDSLRWEQPFLFYRFNPSKSINFRIFNKGLIYDTFIGKTQYHYDSKYLNKDPILVKFPLLDKQGKEIPKIKFEVAFWHTESFVNL